MGSPDDDHTAGKLTPAPNRPQRQDPPTLPPEIADSFRRIRTSLEKDAKHLPGWPETKRAAPNEILRSALFTARNRNQPRLYLKDVEVVVIGEGRVRYRGEELRQDDELAWLHLIHLAKDKPLGQCVEFTPYSFLKEIGWPPSGQSYQRLRTCIVRMVATAIQVSSTRLGLTVAVSMIHRAEFEDPEFRLPLKRWRIWVAPEMQILFGDQAFTLIDLGQRKALPDGIASKLHSYWSSHREPFPVKIATLQRLCGSEMIPKHFKAQLTAALGQLVEVGFLRSWEISSHLVVVQRRKDG